MKIVEDIAAILPGTLFVVLIDIYCLFTTFLEGVLVNDVNDVFTFFFWCSIHQGSCYLKFVVCCA